MVAYFRHSMTVYTSQHGSKRHCVRIDSYRLARSIVSHDQGERSLESDVLGGFVIKGANSVAPLDLWRGMWSMRLNVPLNLQSVNRSCRRNVLAWFGTPSVYIDVGKEETESGCDGTNACNCIFEVGRRSA